VGLKTPRTVAIQARCRHQVRSRTNNATLVTNSLLCLPEENWYANCGRTSEAQADKRKALTYWQRWTGTEACGIYCIQKTVLVHFSATPTWSAAATAGTATAATVVSVTRGSVHEHSSPHTPMKQSTKPQNPELFSRSGCFLRFNNHYRSSNLVALQHDPAPTNA
jgi:hypothetical protein